jgi:cytosine/adenosine deaminase-related metal-dependent hydrolase
VISPNSIAERNAPPEPIRQTTLRLVGGRVATNACEAIRADIEIAGGLIRSISTLGEDPACAHSALPSDAVDLSGYLILPGLINAHDHLEFNLFPRLGNGPYANYAAWAKDIYQPDGSPVREHSAVPEVIRLWWGGLKNLLSGVTTVCHHNPYVPEVFEGDFPVRVVKRFAWAHSLAFGKDVPAAFSSAPLDVPFIIHLAEGTDAKSAEEIFTLRELGALDSRTVVVHGVGLDAEGISLLEKHRAAMVWCPTSNMFTLGKTLSPHTVASFDRLALGSDSALTAQGDLLNEIRFAHQCQGTSPERIFSLVMDLAADVLRLMNDEGTLRPGGIADLIALKDQGKTPAETLVEANSDQIELVVKDGEPKMLSPGMSARWPERFRAGFEHLSAAGIQRLVRAPVGWLVTETRKRLGPRFCLAGKAIES